MRDRGCDSWKLLIYCVDCFQREQEQLQHEQVLLLALVDFVQRQSQIGVVPFT